MRAVVQFCRDFSWSARLIAINWTLLAPVFRDQAVKLLVIPAVFYRAFSHTRRDLLLYRTRVRYRSPSSVKRRYSRISRIAAGLERDSSSPIYPCARTPSSNSRVNGKSNRLLSSSPPADIGAAALPSVIPRSTCFLRVSAGFCVYTEREFR